MLIATIFIGGVKAYQVYTGISSTREGWEICTDSKASAPRRIWGGAKILIGITAVAGPAVSLVGKVVSLFSSGNKAICTANSVNKLITGLNYASSSSLVILKFEEKYLKDHKGEIPTNFKVSFGLFLTAGAILGSGALGGAAIFCEDQTIKKIASFLLRIPIFINDFAIDFSKEQCVSLAHSIIAEFITQLNAMPEIAEKMPSVTKRIYDTLLKLDFLQRNISKLEERLNSLADLLGEKIYCSMTLLRTQRSSREGTATLSEVEEGVSSVPFDSTLSNTGATVFSEEGPVTVEALMDFETHKNYLQQHKAKILEEIKNQINQGKAWRDNIDEEIQSAFFQKQASSYLLETGHSGKKYVCALCQSEIVKPDHVWEHPELDILVSSECLAKKMEVGSICINGQNFSGKDFSLMTMETDPAKTKKLAAFREQYFIFMHRFVCKCFRDVLYESIDSSRETSSSAPPSFVQTSSEMGSSAAGQPVTSNLLRDFGEVKGYINRHQEEILEAMQGQVDEVKKFANGIIMNMLKSIFVQNQAAQYLLETDHPGKKYVCDFCRNEIVQASHYWKYPKEEIPSSAESPIRTDFLISSECFVEACLASRESEYITIGGKNFSKEKFLQITLESNPTETRELLSFRLRYFGLVEVLLERMKI